MESVIKYDTGLFYLVNTGLTSPVLDAVMPFASDKTSAIILALIVLAVLVSRAAGAGGRGGTRGRDLRVFFLVIVAVLAGDMLSAALKEVFMRVRPCHGLEGVRLLAGCGGSYSFPSGHATNIFAAMVFLSVRYRKLTPLFMAVAATVSYSRVYLGVHYPLDVAGGAVLGSGVSLAVSGADRRVIQPVIERIRGKKERVEV